jgi:hypothetical protein
MERIPASERTREKLKTLIEGRGKVEDGRSESHAIGEYTWRVILVGDEVEKFEELIIRVQNPSNATLICASDDHSRRSSPVTAG